nr:hypothetical protein [uncultured Cohaesibacter sp.]
MFDGRVHGLDIGEALVRCQTGLDRDFLKVLLVAAEQGYLIGQRERVPAKEG